MTDEEIHNIYLHMSGKAEGLVEANGTADFPVLFARAILEYERLTKDMQNMASKSTYKEQLETKDEPVGKFAKFTDGIWREVTDYSAGIPLYTTPQPQEFVCSTGLCHLTLTQTNVGIGERGMEAYEAAKERGWVGLTEEDLKLLSAEWRIVYGAWMDDFARDIESKLKEKNHGN